MLVDTGAHSCPSVALSGTISIMISHRTADIVQYTGGLLYFQAVFENTYFTFFSKSKKTRFLRFLKTTCQKPRTRYQSFRMVTLLTFRNTEHTNTKSEHFPECRPKK